MLLQSICVIVITMFAEAESKAIAGPNTTYPPKMYINFKKFQFECCLQTTGQHVLQFKDVDHMLNTYRICDQFVGINVADVELLQLILRSSYNNSMPSLDECLCKKKPENKYIVYMVFWIIVFAVALFGNIFVLVTYCLTSRLRRNVAHIFVMSLAVSDALISSFIIPIKMHTTLHNQKFCSSIAVCRMFFTVDVTFFVASITSLFAVTIDRFIATVLPYMYQTSITRKRARIMLIIMTMYSCLWGLVVHVNPKSGKLDSVTKNSGLCYSVDDKVYVVIYALVFLLPLALMCFMYKKMYCVALKHARQIERQHQHIRAADELRQIVERIPRESDSKRAEVSPCCNKKFDQDDTLLGCMNTTPIEGAGESSQDHSSNDDLIKPVDSNVECNHELSSDGENVRGCCDWQDMFRIGQRICPSKMNIFHGPKNMGWKATKVIFLISGVFIICWLPMVIIFFVMQFKTIRSRYVYSIFSEILPVLHSACNPFIYAIYHREFRRAAKKIFGQALDRWRENYNYWAESK